MPSEDEEELARRFPRANKDAESSVQERAWPCRDEGAEWKEVDVEWSEEYEFVVVFYYKAGSIDAEGLVKIK